MERFLTFDTELAQTPSLAELQEGQDIFSAWPLAISVAATHCQPEGSVDLWYGDWWADEVDMTQMSFRQANDLVSYLIQQHVLGLKIVTWNGTGFDFRLLAQITKRHDTVVALARRSYDPMFQLFCAIGYAPGQDKVAEALDLPRKTLQGHNAPLLWANGEYETVKDYVTGDVITLGLIVKHIVKTRGIRWCTKNGDIHYEFVPKLLTVEQCLKLPMPDTGRMEIKRTREDYTGWWQND